MLAQFRLRSRMSRQIISVPLRLEIVYKCSLSRSKKNPTLFRDGKHLFLCYITFIRVYALTCENPVSAAVPFRRNALISETFRELLSLIIHTVSQNRWVSRLLQTLTYLKFFRVITERKYKVSHKLDFNK